jgi:5-methylcytosine-specific restriction protein A
MGRATAATIVDHARPHRGDSRLFFDPENLVSLCKPHHDTTKQRQEHGRRTIVVDAEGWPLE